MRKYLFKLNSTQSVSGGLPKVSIGKFLFFMLYPFGTLVNSIIHFQSRDAKTIFWLFCLYVGFSFVIPDAVVGAADSARYAIQLEQFHAHGLTLNSLLEIFYNPTKREIVYDIYQPLVTWLVSLFTDNGRILFMVFSGVFGYFYIQNTWIIMDRIPKISKGLIIFITYLFLILPIWEVNGVRMWTAAHVFIYGVLSYFLDGKKRKGILWILSTFLIHFSFMLPILVFLVFQFIPSNTKLYFILFVISSFVNEIDLGVVRNSLNFLPDVFLPKVYEYTSEAYSEVRSMSASQKSLNYQIHGILSNYYFYFIIFYLFFTRKRFFPEASNLKALFDFTLLFGVMAQIASLVPSGGRFIIIYSWLVFALFVFAISFQKNNNLATIIKYISFPILLYFSLFKIRIGFEFLGLSTFLGNPLIVLNLEDQIPLISYFQ